MWGQEVRIWSLPELQVLELLLNPKVQQLTGFSWPVLNHGSSWHGVSISKGCGSAGSASPRSLRSCLKIKHYKSGFHLPDSMEKYKNVTILVGSASAQPGWLWRGGCWCSPTAGSPDPALAGHAAMKAPFISR